MVTAEYHSQPHLHQQPNYDQDFLTSVEHIFLMVKEEKNCAHSILFPQVKLQPRQAEV